MKRSLLLAGERAAAKEYTQSARNGAKNLLRVMQERKKERKERHTKTKRNPKRKKVKKRQKSFFAPKKRQNSSVFSSNSDNREVKEDRFLDLLKKNH